MDRRCFLFLYFERDSACVIVSVRVCSRVCVCVFSCDTVCPLKRNGLGFQQKQQLMIKRFYCQAFCRVTIIMLRSFEQPETLLLVYERLQEVKRCGISFLKQKR